MFVYVLTRVSHDHAGSVSDDSDQKGIANVINSPYVTTECDDVCGVPDDLKRSRDIEFVRDNR